LLAEAYYTQGYRLLLLAGWLTSRATNHSESKKNQFLLLAFQE
jgi:hypothetical protein